MISKENVQVFGNVPKEIKKRMKRIAQGAGEWSESKIIREGVIRLLPELEKQLGPTHDKPRRKSDAA